MSNASGMTLNMTEFDKRLLLANVKVVKIAKVALYEGAAAFKKDCDEIPPKTPHLHGNLRGDTSRSVNINLKSGKSTVKKSNIRKDWQPQTIEENLGVYIFAVLIAYCAPYASRWHETTDNINWSEDGVGPKFMEAKMARQDLRDKYYGLIAKRIKQELEND